MIFWIVLFIGLTVLGCLKAHKDSERWKAAGKDSSVWKPLDALGIMLFGFVTFVAMLFWITLKYTVLYPFVLLAERVRR